MLHYGDKIAVIAPSWRVDATALAAGVEKLQSLGLEVWVHPQCSLKYGQFAGTPRLRAEALNECFADDSIKAIFCARGGYGAAQTLEYLDYERIKNTPKPLIGFSDATALLNALHTKSGLITRHGPLVQWLGKDSPASDLDHLQQALFQRAGSLSLGNASPIRPGQAQGVLVGGNASVFDQLIGTPYFPNHERLILCLEDLDEKINDLDKYLLHLKHTGLLRRIKGLILGDLQLGDNDYPFGKSVPQLVNDYLPDTPCVMNAPFGHGEQNICLPIGLPVTLNAACMQLKLHWPNDTTMKAA